MSNKLCETVVVEFEEYTDIDFREISSYFIRNCLGQRVYFKTRSREIAQATCDDMFSKGHYLISSGKLSKSPESQSAVGRINSRSRAGMRKS